MYSLCVFAGTTEGRRLLEFLSGQPVRVLACVATRYGGSLIPECDNIEISARRLDEKEMEALFVQRCFDLVLDATHPYADRASESVAAACEATGTQYLRLSRGGSAKDDRAVWVDSPQAAADWLAARQGVALLTTGSKALAPFAAVEGFRERFFARVLPVQASLEACEALGFAPSHIIAMQGPFSVEMNVAMLHSIGADYLVTKDSGDCGGFSEKLEAAEKAGARCVVIGRPPQGEGLDFVRTVRLLMDRFDLADVRQIDVIGIGMGACGSLTLDARRALEQADCCVGAQRMLEAVAGFGKPAFARIAPDGIVEVIDAHPQYRRVAVVMSGDPGFFSGARKLLGRLQRHHVRVYPGISSLQALCARLGTPWDDVAVVSLHGRDGSVIPALRRRGRVFVLTDGSDALRRLCEWLCGAGMGDARICVGQRLSYPDESILTGTALTLRQAECAPLSAMLIEYDGQRQQLPVGLPDEAFIRRQGGEGRTVPMTKSEARAVSISKLRLAEDSVLWDVGAGTGSISIEAALLCPVGHVYAVECREDAASLIEENEKRFAPGNLTVVRGTAPGALEVLPTPTHVFIGGSSQSMRRIVEVALARNPNARFVINAITLESVGEIVRLARELRFLEREIVQVVVARSREIGDHHLMGGLNPVWIAALQGAEGGATDEDRA